MVTLVCMLVGVHGSAFLVDIDPSRFVEDLKEVIKAEKEDEFKTVDADELKLFLAKKGDAWLTRDGAEAVTLDELAQSFEEMDSTLWIKNAKYFGENFAPSKREIHVLVEIHASAHASILQDNGATISWRERFHAARLLPDFLPPRAPLSRFIQLELPVKISIHPHFLDKWAPMLTPQDPQLLASLFECTYVNSCADLCLNVLSQVVSPPDISGNCLTSFWDANLRSVLNFMFPGIGHSDRGSYGSSSTEPDYVFILKSVCVFRGEETMAAVDMETPRLELAEQMIWSYGAVPYLFGYSAVGTKVSLYALVRDDGQVDSIHLASFQLNIFGERLRLLLALLNVSHLLLSIADMCPASGRNEDQTFIRGNGVIVRLKQSYVVKSYLQRATFDAVVGHLKQVYGILSKHQVPNVDNLVQKKLIAMHLRFEPRGIEIKPSNLSELFCALQNVLEALVRLHQAQWMHRDIRWPNVMKRCDDSGSWFLIDFVDSASSPQPTLRGGVLSKEKHAPEIFLDNVEHTTAVDIWSVGYLIRTSGDAYTGWHDRAARTQFYKRLVDCDPLKRPSAEEALKTLNVLELEYKRHGRDSTEPKSKKLKKGIAS